MLMQKSDEGFRKMSFLGEEGKEGSGGPACVRGVGKAAAVEINGHLGQTYCGADKSCHGTLDGEDGGL